MTDFLVALLDSGAQGVVSSVLPAKRGRGRPRGSKDTKPRKQYVAQQQGNAICASPECKASFTPTMPHQHFCSAKCRNKVNSKASQARRRDGEPRSCRWCGTTYIPEYGSLRTHYCTTECRDAAKKKVRSGSTHRRRAAKYGGHYEPVSKRKVFERDGWRCYLCGVATPKELSGTTEPNAPELDHVMPLAAGGAHCYENVKCACRKCNREKGAKVHYKPTPPSHLHSFATETDRFPSQP